MSTQPLNLLLICGDPELTQQYCQGLSEVPGLLAGLEHAEDAQRGLSLLSEWVADVVVLDEGSDSDAAKIGELLKQIRRQRGAPPVVVLLAKEDPAYAAQCIEAGAADCVDRHDTHPRLLARAVQLAALQERLRCESRNKQELRGELETVTALVEAKEQRLQRMYKSTARFVDGVAQEFSTPLAVIEELSNLIEDRKAGPLTETQALHMRQVVHASWDLARLVDNVVDSGQLKAGALTLDRRPLHVSQVFEIATKAVARYAGEKKIEITQVVAPEAVETFADLDTTGRALTNVTVHAIKSCPAGGMVKLWSRRGPDGTVSLCISHPDTARKPEEVAAELDRFHQAGDGLAPSTTGLGLGLSVARELVWLSLGDVGLTHDPSRGTTYHIMLPRFDPRTIVDRYLDRFAGSSIRKTDISVAKISLQGQGGDIDEVRAFMASASYPSDLVLPATDNQSIIAIGLTKEPHRWIGRLMAARRKKIQACTFETLANLDINCLGVWSCPQETEVATALVLEHIRRDAPSPVTNPAAQARS